MQIVSLDPGSDRLDEVFPVLAELRDHLTLDEFKRLYGQGHPDGYRVVALFDEGACRAVGGYRILTNLVHGRVLYIDDLVTRAADRSRGYGKALNDYLVQLAEGAGCVAVTLDSHTNRSGAHKFYLREGYAITSFHFGRPLH